MGIQGLLDLARRRQDLLLGRPATDQGEHVLKVLFPQHLWLRKRKLINGIVGNIRPVDQFFGDVVVDPEGKYGGDRLHRGELRRRETFELRNLVDVSACIDSERTAVG
jgi:hypothetical protein